jgi:hypothetical protein
MRPIAYLLESLAISSGTGAANAPAHPLPEGIPQHD